MSSSNELTRSALADFPLPPVTNGGKETKGRVLIIAGSRQLPGAALLAAESAMRSGAGKLRIAIGDSLAPAIGVAMPEARVIGLPENEEGGLAAAAVDEIACRAAEVNAVVAGPGMERSELCATIAERLLESPAQLVLDAAILHSLKPSHSGGRSDDRLPLLLPHAGELASLLDVAKEQVEADPVGFGRLTAERHRAHVLVKGVTSHVVAADGRDWMFRGGAPGLGVSGSGDVLAGIAVGLLARGAEPLTALLWSVLLHGEAGEMLADQIGPAGFLAREIPEQIPALLSR